MAKEKTLEMKVAALKQMISQGRINQILYTYRPDNENTKKVFTEKTLWFAHPKDFNDPFDCWANIQVLDIKNLSNRINLHNSVKEKGLERLTIYELKQTVDNVLNQLGICCFTMNNKNILMWSHYAHFHQGVCLEFDILQDPDFFFMPFPVEYVDSMPEYNHPIDSKKLIEKIIQPKANFWKYEKEVRIIRTSDVIKKNNNNQAFKFEPKALKKVIFGCKTSDNTINKYKELCNSNGLNHVTFSQMHQKDNGQFELEEKTI